ncbi:MAG: hypothetical protein CMP61_05385 [Flavobacteriales bacterium]|nr:hypothetical protein [Flavobacteriales bacterium]|tara:strand:+ start:37145 stop:37855 length:711 start_codon:yes stop_codon:yes gene_type:complete
MKSYFLSLLCIVFLCQCSYNKIKGKGRSLSKGSVKKGSLKNGRRFPKKGTNFKYFSKLTYFIDNRAWVHEKVCMATLEAYKICEQMMPERKFMIMECSHRKGGKMFPHRTHQNGTSIDFASPLTKNNHPYHGDQWKGIWHYGLQFDEKGRCMRNKKIRIDFEDMAKHILALEKAAKKRGLYIKKVLLKMNLKDDFFATPSGKKVKEKGIYFARYLTPMIDMVHDDHYHIDFGFLKK